MLSMGDEVDIHRPKDSTAPYVQISINSLSTVANVTYYRRYFTDFLSAFGGLVVMVGSTVRFLMLGYQEFVH